MSLVFLSNTFFLLLVLRQKLAHGTTAIIIFFNANIITFFLSFLIHTNLPRNFLLPTYLYTNLATRFLLIPINHWQWFPHNIWKFILFLTTTSLISFFLLPVLRRMFLITSSLATFFIPKLPLIYSHCCYNGRHLSWNLVNISSSHPVLTIIQKKLDMLTVFCTVSLCTLLCKNKNRRKKSW